MSESRNPAQVAAQDQMDARWKDVAGQVETKLRRNYRTMHHVNPGPAEMGIVNLWNAVLDSDINFVCCRHDTDRYYWIIDRPALLCEMCWDIYEHVIGPRICLDHMCRRCHRHQRNGMEYHMHVLVFSGEVGPDAQQLPVLIIPFTLCDVCEKEENAARP